MANHHDCLRAVHNSPAIAWRQMRFLAVRYCRLRLNWLRRSAWFHTTKWCGFSFTTAGAHKLCKWWSNSMLFNWTVVAPGAPEWFKQANSQREEKSSAEVFLPSLNGGTILLWHSHTLWFLRDASADLDLMVMVQGLRPWFHSDSPCLVLLPPWRPFWKKTVYLRVQCLSQLAAGRNGFDSLKTLHDIAAGSLQKRLSQPFQPQYWKTQPLDTKVSAQSLDPSKHCEK